MWREKEKGNHNKGNHPHNNMTLLFLRMASIWEKRTGPVSAKHPQILTGTGPSANWAAGMGKAKDGRICAISGKNKEKEKNRLDKYGCIA